MHVVKWSYDGGYWDVNTKMLIEHQGNRVMTNDRSLCFNHAM